MRNKKRVTDNKIFIIPIVTTIIGVIYYIFFLRDLDSMGPFGELAAFSIGVPVGFGIILANVLNLKINYGTAKNQAAGVAAGALMIGLGILSFFMPLFF